MTLRKQIYIDNIKNFFTGLSSAIILNVEDNRYWLCHGGFPLPTKLLSPENNNNKQPNFDLENEENSNIYIKNDFGFIIKNIKNNDNNIPINLV
jgi:hypothetical protein